MTVRNANKTLRFGTPAASARSAVILIHGRGSSPQDMLGLAHALPSEGVAFLAPAADGGVWYPQRFFAPLENNEPDLSAALDLVGRLVAELQAAGVAAERIGLIGFSQGACLSLEFVARNPRRYGFVAGLSGALIGPHNTPRQTGDLRGTPILLGCAESDPHIPIAYVERSAEILLTFGADVAKHIFPGAAHTVFKEEIEWLEHRLSR